MRAQFLTRRLAVAAGLALALAPAAAHAQDKVAVGVLRFVSSGGFYLAYERGYFKAEGIDVDIKYFEAAQPIAVAIASGDTQFGLTAVTAGTFNLAGKGALKIVASQGTEKKGFQGNGLVVSNQAWDKGITAFDKLPGTAIAITQVGSSFHYQLGQIAAEKGFDLKSISMKPLQSLPNMIAALKGNQVDGMLIAPHIAKPMVARGEAKLVGWYSDVAEYQFGALFASSKLVAEKRDVVQRFVRAYQKGMADFGVLLKTDAKGERVFDAASDEAAALIAKHVYPSDPVEKGAAQVKAAATYLDPKARIDASDFEKQIAWYKKEGMVDAGVDAKAFVDTSFAQ